MAGTRDALDSMAPWDAAPYFQTPKETLVSLDVSPKILCRADPMRVALIISTNSSMPGILVGLTSNPGFTNVGIPIQSSQLPLVILFAETGPLCQQQWNVSPGTGQTVTVYEIILSKWPTIKPRKKASRANPAKPDQRNRNGR